MTMSNSKPRRSEANITSNNNTADGKSGNQQFKTMVTLAVLEVVRTSNCVAIKCTSRENACACSAHHDPQKCIRLSPLMNGGMFAHGLSMSKKPRACTDSCAKGPCMHSPTLIHSRLHVTKFRVWWFLYVKGGKQLMLLLAGTNV